jgi:hypothetical protein
MSRCHLRVATDIVGADTEISNLQSFDIVDIQALVKNTMLDNAVAFLGRHGAGL